MSEPRVYKTETEKVDALVAIQEQPGGPSVDDVDEIRAIREATVEEQPGAVGDEQAEPRPLPAEPPESPEPVVDQEPPAEPQSKQEPESATPWVITPDMIPKDTYYDVQSGRTRPFVTQKSAPELIKSYVEAQKFIQRSHRERADSDAAHKRELQDRVAAYNSQLAEAKKTIASLTGERDEAKQALVTAPKNGTPPHDDLTGLVETLGSPDEDLATAYPEVAKLYGVVPALARQVQAQQALLKDQSDKIASMKAPAQPQEQVPPAPKPASDEPVAAEIDHKRMEMYNNLMAEIDRMAPEILGETPTQSFREMDDEATRFRRDVTEAYYNQALDPSHEHYSNMRENAIANYLAGNPDLMGRLREKNVTVPANWESWVVLDEVDALRNGWVRDPSTKEWVQRTTYDYRTGQNVPVNLGSVDIAWSAYKDIHGINSAMVHDARKQTARKFAKVASERDVGVTSMDTSDLSDQGRGTVMSAEQAASELQAQDMDRVMGAAMNGDMTMLNRVNQAMAVLGRPPIPFEPAYMPPR